MKTNKPLFLSLSFSLVLGLTACSDESWSRGQAPSVSTLIQSANQRLSKTIDRDPAGRPELGSISKNIQASMVAALDVAKRRGPHRELSDKLTQAQKHLLKLEDMLTPGSKPAYGELSGQLRTTLADNASGRRITYARLGLLTARTLSFLADELNIPL